MIADNPARVAGPGELRSDRAFEDPYDREPPELDLPPLPKRPLLDFGIKRDTTSDTSTRLRQLEDPEFDVQTQPITATEILRRAEELGQEERYRERVLSFQPEHMRAVDTTELRIMLTYARRYAQRYAERERLLSQIVSDRTALAGRSVVTDDGVPEFLRLQE